MERHINNKNILVTGHTGFKGSWLCLWLCMLGANVTGYSLENDDPASNFVLSDIKRHICHLTGDIRDVDSLKKAFRAAKPDAVMHLAAQPIVKHALADPRHTYDVNVMGTLNVLEEIKTCNSCKGSVMVTSDKCYSNEEWVWGYRETDRIGGHDIYSSSKGCDELLIDAYRHSYPSVFGPGGKLLVSARSGNVVGGGDWGDYRLMPDCIRALTTGETIVLRSPQSVRPWQHVLEPLSGYLMLLEKVLEQDYRFTGGWNFGPNYKNAVTVEYLVRKVISAWGSGSYVCDESARIPEANLLNLDTSKARCALHWSPVWDIDTTVDKTVEWYKKSAEGDTAALCLNQIGEYSAAMNNLRTE